MDILIMIGQLILSLSILIGLHEAGHMITAKWFGMRVSKFFIGFPPTLFSRQIGDTEYGIGSVPLGGFVKIEGMVDESLDTQNLSTTPEPWEFRAKPAWQRMVVMLGGIIVNFLLGIFIFICLTWINGEYFLPNAELKQGIYANKLGEEIGFRTGDKIVLVNGKPIRKFSQALDPEVIFNPESYYVVNRGGQEVRINLPKDLITKLSKDEGKSAFISAAQPFEVALVSDGLGAKAGGILPGDKILAINDHPISFFQDMKPTLEKYKCCTVNVKVLHKGSDSIVNLSCVVNKNAQLGFVPKSLLSDSSEHFPFFASIAKGYDHAISIIKINLFGFSKIFSGEVSASDSVSGPIGIAKNFFGGRFSWINFWTNTAILSLILAFMNLLPIPALDGGHVVFLLYEMIARRAPSLKFMEWAQKIGMVLVLGLMIFAFGNDIYKQFASPKDDSCKCQEQAISLINTPAGKAILH